MRWTADPTNVVRCRMLLFVMIPLVLAAVSVAIIPVLVMIMIEHQERRVRSTGTPDAPRWRAPDGGGTSDVAAPVPADHRHELVRAD